MFAYLADLCISAWLHLTSKQQHGVHLANWMSPGQMSAMTSSKEDFCHAAVLFWWLSRPSSTCNPVPLTKPNKYIKLFKFTNTANSNLKSLISSRMWRNWLRVTYSQTLHVYPISHVHSCCLYEESCQCCMITSSGVPTFHQVELKGKIDRCLHDKESATCCELSVCPVVALAWYNTIAFQASCHVPSPLSGFRKSNDTEVP